MEDTATLMDNFRVFIGGGGGNPQANALFVVFLSSMHNKSYFNLRRRPLNWLECFA